MLARHSLHGMPAIRLAAKLVPSLGSVREGEQVHGHGDTRLHCGAVYAFVDTKTPRKRFSGGARGGET